MKTTKIRKNIYKLNNSFPKVYANPKENEVWLALFPYETLGNMEKMRPVLIKEVKEDTVICQKIGTGDNGKGKKIKGTLNKNKHYYFLNKPSYLKNSVCELPKYKLYGKIRNEIEFEEK